MPQWGPGSSITMVVIAQFGVAVHACGPRTLEATGGGVRVKDFLGYKGKPSFNTKQKKQKVVSMLLCIVAVTNYRKYSNLINLL